MTWLLDDPDHLAGAVVIAACLVWLVAAYAGRARHRWQTELHIHAALTVAHDLPHKRPTLRALWRALSKED